MSRTVAHDYFLTSGLADVFVRRLTGFIADNRARLIDVSENGARLLVGGRTFGQWFRGEQFLPRTEVSLQFLHNVGSGDTGRGRNAEIGVDVEIRPRSLFRWQKAGAKDSDRVARYLTRELRAYFVV